MTKENCEIRLKDYQYLNDSILKHKSDSHSILITLIHCAPKFENDDSDYEIMVNYKIEGLAGVHVDTLDGIFSRYSL